MVIKKRAQLTATQKAILREMIRSRRPQTTYRLSKKSDRAWRTAKVNLESLRRKGVVTKKTQNKVARWTIK